MKKAYFITLFVGMHIIFIILQIHKQSSFIKLSYDKQRLEKEKRELLTQKDTLTQQLSQLQDHETIKEFALNRLKMKQVSLKQIRHTDDTSKL